MIKLILGSVSLVLLVAALVLALAGWHQDHSRLRTETKKISNLPQMLHDETSTATNLDQQHLQDVASLQQLRHDLDQANGEVRDLTAKLAKQTESLADQQRDYTSLSADFNDVRVRETSMAAQESQYFQLYTQSNQTTLDQREYIKGLYLDDLTLRQSLHESPYAPPASPVATTTVLQANAPPAPGGKKHHQAQTAAANSPAPRQDALDAPP